MLLEIYKKGILTSKTVAFYFHAITAFCFIIAQGSGNGNKKRADVGIRPYEYSRYCA